MAYGHAERTLATIRLLEAATRELLSRQKHLEPEHAKWLRQAAESASRRLRPGSAADTRTAHDQAGVGLSRRVEPPPVRQVFRYPEWAKPGAGRWHGSKSKPVSAASHLAYAVEPEVTRDGKRQDSTAVRSQSACARPAMRSARPARPAPVTSSAPNHARRASSTATAQAHTAGRSPTAPTDPAATPRPATAPARRNRSTPRPHAEPSRRSARGSAPPGGRHDIHLGRGPRQRRPPARHLGSGNDDVEAGDLRGDST